MFKEFLNNIINDVKVELSQEFDRNFERKAFFDKKWNDTKLKNSRGSLMMRTGRLRRSLKSTAANGQITWSSNMPYASLQNDGGEIVVTAKMKRFFWAMFYKANGAANVFSIKTKKRVNNQRTIKLDAEAEQWKALALQKIGAVMTVEQRQYIGWHPKVDLHIQKVVDTNLKELNTKIQQKLKP